MVWFDLGTLIRFNFSTERLVVSAVYLVAAFHFLEEIIPFTDIIPTFTIAWYIQQKLKPAEKTNNGKIEDAEVIEIT